MRKVAKSGWHELVVHPMIGGELILVTGQNILTDEIRGFLGHTLPIQVQLSFIFLALKNRRFCPRILIQLGP